MQATPEERFWTKVDKRGKSECWLWTGGKVSGGYGNISIAGKSISVHRYSWQIHYGNIPDGLCVLHTCDTPACANPAHLFLGTHADNVADMERKGRQPRREKHGRAKLTEAKVKAVFLERGMTQQQIADKYDVSRGQIGHILNGRSWA